MNDARSVRGIGAIALAGTWVGVSEFVRNQLLIDSLWQSHYESLGIAFPTAPANAAVWMVWSFVFAATLFWISRRFPLLQTTLIGWIVGFVMMWLVIWNLSVLPLSTLPVAVPLSLLESFVASYICLKVAPPQVP